MEQKLHDIISSMEPQLIDMLNRWIAVPSVKDTPAEGAPFGAEVRRMLDMAIADVEALGFPTRNFDGYAMDATLGDAEEAIAVLGHLDVVPAGDGWQTPPFTPTRDGDKIYGRGTSDDKGPVIAALLAMKAIKDAGIPLKRSIRLILGCDEESGWEDMAYYASHAQMPEIGFSPDASFPVINTEKGMLHVYMHAPVAETGLKILKLHTGERVNVIPGECQVLLGGQADVLAEQIAAFRDETKLPYDYEITPDGILVTAHGIPGHAAYPFGCRNAIGMMLLLLRKLGAEGPIATLADAVGMEYNGASLGIACEDEVSGALTCNIGILHIEDGNVIATLDCRCPITADLDQLRSNAIAHLPGFIIDAAETKEPHHVPAESELVSALLAAYHEETGLEPKAMSTGGGTYAKVLKQGVAYGAAFPDDEDLAHQAGEYAKISSLMKSVRVFANALLRLAAE